MSENNKALVAAEKTVESFKKLSAEKYNNYVESGEIYHAHCSECNNEPDRNIGGDYYIDKLSSRKR